MVQFSFSLSYDVTSSLDNFASGGKQAVVYSRAIEIKRVCFLATLKYRTNVQELRDLSEVVLPCDTGNS